MSDIVFTARFAGTCPACLQSIAEGHDLTWDDDHPAIHALCRYREPKPTPVCPRCFQATSVTGRCGCDE